MPAPVIRPIKALWTSRPTIEGAGVHLKRAFGGQAHAADFDPFLLFDDFHADDPADFLPGFPWHPHRGIETITCVLDGDVEHQDSLGNGGVMHQEMPKGSREGKLVGFQLWANLPKKS